MAKKSLFDIKILEDGSVDLTANYKNTVTQKTTTLQHFLSTFGQSFSTFETPILPQNCRKIIKSSNSELYIFEYNASSRSLMYNNTTYNDVYCPRTLFIIKIATNGASRSIVKADIFVLDPLTPFGINMPLYKWCFNNYAYYPNSSSYICWGQNGDTLNRILLGDSSGFGSIFNLYMSSGFNNHLEPNINWGAIQREHGRERMQALIDYLQKNKVFPMNITSQVEDTIASIIARFKEGRY